MGGGQRDEQRRGGEGKEGKQEENQTGWCFRVKRGKKESWKKLGSRLR